MLMVLFLYICGYTFGKADAVKLLVVYYVKFKASIVELPFNMFGFPNELYLFKLYNIVKSSDYIVLLIIFSDP